MNIQTEEKIVPWYKQKWPWFIISFPLLTVVAGVITYKIANDKPHSLVNADYFKQGLAINETLAKKQKAKELGLNAKILTDTSNQLLSLILTSSDTPNAQANFGDLIINFSHPTQEKKDIQLELSKLSKNEFIAELPSLPQAYWHILISDKAQTWELKSRWHYPESELLTINAIKQ